MAERRPFRARAGKGVVRAPAREPKSVTHLGARLHTRRWGLELNREVFADFNVSPSFATLERRVGMHNPRVLETSAWKYTDDTRRVYAEEYLEQLRGPALRNFDLNMAFFQRLNPDRFEQALTELRETFPKLEPVLDVETLTGVPGVYVMVLDRYRQVYIGRSSDIRRRIRQHWTSMTALDRLIFGDETTSTLPIDVFRALDTTRLFAVRKPRHTSLEEKMVASFPADYRLNRAPGGDLGPLWAVHVAAAHRGRRLTDD
jgi:hypothetical protein